MKIAWLKQLLGNIDVDTRESAACLLGIASSAVPTSKSHAVITELISFVTERNKLRYVILISKKVLLAIMTSRLYVLSLMA